jgi:hypothetical protein
MDPVQMSELVQTAAEAMRDIDGELRVVVFVSKVMDGGGSMRGANCQRGYDSDDEALMDVEVQIAIAREVMAKEAQPELGTPDGPVI